jgi:hypothetical protein
MLGLGVALAGIDYAETKRNNVILLINPKGDSNMKLPKLHRGSNNVLFQIFRITIRVKNSEESHAGRVSTEI